MHTRVQMVVLDAKRVPKYRRPTKPSEMFVEIKHVV